MLANIALPYKTNAKGNFERTEFPDPELNAGGAITLSAYDVLIVAVDSSHQAKNTGDRRLNRRRM